LAPIHRPLKVALNMCIPILLLVLFRGSGLAQNTETIPPRKLQVEKEIPVYSYRIINTYAHDPEGFTQGLVFEDGVLYESTGLYGRSSLRKVELKTGRVLKSYALPSRYFAEGITVFRDRIFQLTWRSRIGMVYEKKSFQLLKTFNYSSEGWGIAHDSARLFMSDGTETIRILHPDSYEEIARLSVRDRNGPVKGLNELEFVEGEIYANVWPTERIARIDPETGFVVGWIDLKGLLTVEDRLRRADVLNGIAYDRQGKRLFVTGKRWSRLFEIQLKEVK